MTKLRVIDLFAGIGGFSLGLDRTGGFEPAAFCEINPYSRKVLAKHWPEVPQYDDITTADFGSIGPVDVVTAGFPCQDISLAGKGAGLTGERSGLFWHILRTVRMVGRPKLLLENVAALLDRGLGSVLGALAEIGYDSEWHCIPASYVGHSHRRDRIWIVADPNRPGFQAPRYEFEPAGDHQCSAAEWRSFEAGSLRASNGLPNRMDRTKALGNAVVPQIPEMIGHAILEARAAA